MQKIRVLFLPIAEVLRDTGTGILLVAGFNVCFAIATFIAYEVTGDAELGRGWFMRLMEVRDIGFSDFIRQCAEIFNWCALGVMVVFFLFSLGARVVAHVENVRHDAI